MRKQPACTPALSSRANYAYAVGASPHAGPMYSHVYSGKLAWDRRFERLERKIEYYDPDILALQVT